ncbi:hypothetical protein B0A52_01700 [Exophiala mesophila]|uniref:DUF676 domain-containing protein n=1 Tax=Exophiala mesophila TaxID=212818 RepID=A0A438NFR2_EXOME|nr:hypothetical protein B0A52_01700 [Exophiala mesophila]
MLLIHQTGSVKVGEVVRYTVTYTPSLDRILPPPTHLHVKIKNTSAIPLRAAYLHGPYTLYVSCYPSTFDPYQKFDDVKLHGAPEYEPQLKAGGHWNATLTVPESVREDAHHSNSARFDGSKSSRKSFTWIIELASQVIFSTTATVHYEVLIGRDEKSVDLGFHGVVGSGQGAPGKLEDHQQNRTNPTGQPKGVFSKAVRLSIDDTNSLWNTPPFPEFKKDGDVKVQEGPQHGDKRDADAKPDEKQHKQQKIHLVLLTHGLHSNLGADMLYMKESIDTAAKQARLDSKKRKAQMRADQLAKAKKSSAKAQGQRSTSAPEVLPGGLEDEDTDADEEQVIVRGFNGNAVRTERGIQYLGKRLAKYVLSITYPDQPYLPVKSSISKSITKTLIGAKPNLPEGTHLTHKNSSIVKDENHKNHHMPYKITSISFVSHSLGGLIQTYAIAYIQKHSPDFFDLIEPVNFVAMATPFLGLSNENPMYVKFALDFGLVGRTGRDLGLTWRAPTLAKSGWGAVISGLTSESQNAQKEPDPGAKPLLRILPTGPAHTALKRFRNRTVYSNVVNDGIVPLRTSCLLFLDWRGLGRVEKARRENGLVGTMVGWGWAEMTGQNASASRKALTWNDLFGDSGDETPRSGKASPDPESAVPAAEASLAFDSYDTAPTVERQGGEVKKSEATTATQDSPVTGASLWSGLMSLLKPQAGQKPEPKSPTKTQRILRRGQTMHHHNNNQSDTERSRHNSFTSDASLTEGGRSPGLVRGSSLYTNNSDDGNLEAPPKTTFFEAAGDVLNPPLPSQDFILDPGARPRTIFHDRVYHPQDIPPPPAKRQRTTLLPRRTGSRDATTSQQSLNSTTTLDHVQSESSQSSVGRPQPVGQMKIEEKIARAYHKDLSWRKVLVRLEPDAHNNMIVRRMFANAYGWPVVKHMCDTHFAYTVAARTRDDEEAAVERAEASDKAVRSDGEEVKGQSDQPNFQGVAGNSDQMPRHADSADDLDLTPTSPAALEGIQEDLEQLHTHWKAESSRKRTIRTESESREARDDVSELVTMVNATGITSSAAGYPNTNSGKAALSRLARQDSARWSDHFFEGSEDDYTEDDDTILATEIDKARAREELQKAGSTGSAERMQARIAEGLTISPQMTRQTATMDKMGGPSTQGVILTDSTLMSEPGEIEPLSRGSGNETPVLEDHLNPGSVTAFSTNTNPLGLALSERASEAIAQGGDVGQRSSSVAEQVAEQMAAAQAKKQ